MTSCCTIAILPDIHVPIHDVHALDVVEQILATTRLDAMVQVGDLVDHESISRFAQGQPRKMSAISLLEEWDAARPVMRRLVKAARTKFPRCRWYQLEGNHETRVLKFAGLHPQLEGLLRLPKYLGVEDDGKAMWVPADSQGRVLRFVWERNGTVVPRVVSPTEPDPFPMPGLSIVHGWAHSMNADKQTADMSPWPGPIVAGHAHRIAVKTSKRFGLMTQPSAHIIGTLGMISPEYVAGKPTGWEQSFAIAHLALGHPMVYRVDIVRVNNGMAIGPDGKIYRSRVKS